MAVIPTVGPPPFMRHSLVVEERRRWPAPIFVEALQLSELFLALRGSPTLSSSRISMGGRTIVYLTEEGTALDATLTNRVRTWPRKREVSRNARSRKARTT